MFYIDSSMSNAPAIIGSNAGILLNVLKKVLIEGSISVDFDKIDNNVIYSNFGIKSHELAKYEFSDGFNSVVSEITAINQNSFIVKEDISILDQSNIKITYPIVNDWTYVQEGGSHIFRNKFNAGIIFDASNEVVYTFSGENKSETGYIWANKFYSLIYSNDAIFFITAEENNGKVLTSSLVAIFSSFIADEVIDYRSLKGSDDYNYEKICKAYINDALKLGESILTFAYSKNMTSALTISSVFVDGIEMKTLKNVAGYLPIKNGISRISNSGYVSINLVHNRRIIIKYD